MEFTGEVKKKIVKSGVTKNGADFKAFQYKIEEVTGGMYPQAMLADVFGDKVEELNVGDHVTVHFNMKCNEYEGKLYGKNDVWKLTGLVRGTSAQEMESSVATYDPLAGMPQPSASTAASEAGATGAPEEDLPF